MHWSRAETAAWVIAILGIVAMGIIVAHGPFHNINKVQSKAAFGPIKVSIVTDPKTVARYVPKTITLHVGQVVTFKNVSDAPHTVTDRQNRFDSGNLATGGATWSYTGKTPGTYPYYCLYHPLMLGTLKVVK